MRLVSTAVPALALALLASGGARAARCTAIDAMIATHLVFPCPDNNLSPVGLCTAGSVDSGPLAGATSFAALTLTTTRVPTVFHYTGRLIITTSSGDTLTIRDRGVLDLGNRKYFEFQKVVGGTGALAGAKGMLTSQGQLTPDPLTGFFLFEGSLDGQVCRSHGHPGGDGDDKDADDSADAEGAAAE